MQGAHRPEIYELKRLSAWEKRRPKVERFLELYEANPFEDHKQLLGQCALGKRELYQFFRQSEAKSPALFERLLEVYGATCDACGDKGYKHSYISRGEYYNHAVIMLFFCSDECEQWWDEEDLER